MMRQEFGVHILNEVGIEKATVLAHVFSNALDAIEKLIPPGRELALVVTKLQEASFFAKRGVALDATNQKEI